MSRRRRYPAAVAVAVAVPLPYPPLLAWALSHPAENFACSFLWSRTRSSYGAAQGYDKQQTRHKQTQGHYGDYDKVGAGLIGANK